MIGRLFGQRTQQRSFDGASHSHRLGDLRKAGGASANQEIWGALKTLRNRSRNLVQNNVWANKAIAAIVKNTIGEGIRPAPLGTINDNKRITRLWEQWAETTACDWNEQTNIYGLQEQVMRSIAEGGDCLVVIKHTNDPIPIRLMLLEGDYIDESRTTVNEMGTARLGIQYDDAGRKIGYWLWERHPGDFLPDKGKTFTSKYYPKKDILNVFEIIRIGQVRGVPFGAAAIVRLNDFKEYEEAQLVKQKVAAMYTLFNIESPGQTDARDVDYEYEVSDHITPGLVETLPNGAQVVTAEPPSVGDYKDYSVKILQGIASCFGITYEMLTSDYSNVNYTSGRMAKIDVSSTFRSWQYNMIVPMMLAPIWEAFIDACIITGAIRKRISCSWTAPKVQLLDPEKEYKARVIALEAGFQTLDEIIREDGRDPEEFALEYAQGIQRLQALGFTPLWAQNNINLQLKTEQNVE